MYIIILKKRITNRYVGLSKTDLATALWHRADNMRNIHTF